MKKVFLVSIIIFLAVNSNLTGAFSETAPTEEPKELKEPKELQTPEQPKELQAPEQPKELQAPEQPKELQEPKKDSKKKPKKEPKESQEPNRKDRIIKQLQASLNDSESKTAGLLKSNDKLSKRVKELEADNDGSKKKIGHLESEVKHLTKSNTKLNKKKEELSKRLTKSEMLKSQFERKAKEFFIAKKDYNEMKETSVRMGKLMEASNKERLILKRKDEGLEKTIISLQSEKSRLCLELGNAYTRLKLYEPAISAYEKCIAIDNTAADAYYNLGLLYKYHNNDREKAAKYLTKYLELNPKGKNKDEVKYLITMLREGKEWDMLSW